MNRHIMLLLTVICISMLSHNVFAADNHNHKSPYAGQQARVIKTLSPDDIKQLNEGQGWGLAKAAELNGIPGPAHLLEMKNEIDLTEPQVKKIQQLFNKMNEKARKLGRRLIQLEAELNQAFANRKINKLKLLEKLSAIEKVRKDLRYVHLVTHLETPSILSTEQIEKYNQLRGYSSDPCSKVPQGHDREMWLKHNNC